MRASRCLSWPARYHVLPVAIVFDLPPDLLPGAESYAAGSAVRHARRCASHASSCSVCLRKLGDEGFRGVHVLVVG